MSSENGRITLRMEVKTVALTPIAHFTDDREGRDGNFCAFNFIPVMHGEEICRVPAVSGNSMRGILRDALAKIVCRRMGRKIDKDLFQLLFSGGKLERSKNKKGGKKNGKGESGDNNGKKESPIDVEKLARIREVNRVIDLMGASVGKSIIRGRLRVGWMVPVALETTRLMGRDFLDWAGIDEGGGQTMISAHDLRRIEMLQTRRDDTRDVDLAEAFLRPGEVIDLDEKMAGNDDDDKDKKDAGRAMFIKFQVMPAGTILRSVFQVTNAEPATMGALFAGLEEFARSGACLGGKIASGYGEIEMQGRDFDDHHEVFRLDPNGFHLAPDYQSMIDEFNRWLDSIDPVEFEAAMKE